MASPADAARFQHYQVLRHPDGSLWELGRGAMGVTYKASDTSLRSEVALKVISAEYLNSDTARQRFLREARAAAQLRHPNVATVFHLGEADGAFFYAMEFVDGETLEARVGREGPLRADVALRITRQVARALIAADRQRLVHRDIKPANIMLVRDDDEDHLLVKVIDFGLAKSLAAAVDGSVTVTLGGFVGTPHFASPEQLEEREIDVRSDLYSLGASLWYILTGRPPFSGSLASVIHQHLGQELPADVLAQMPPRVADLLRRLLAKRPEDRIQTPADLKATLDDLITEMQGNSPTIALGAPADDHHGGAGGSSSGFATGRVIRGRYELLGPSPTDRALFRAKDLLSNRTVALRLLPEDLRHQPDRLEAIRQEVARVKGIHHPNVVAVHGLEEHGRGFMLVGDWVNGFSLQDLLRTRRELSWAETDRLLRPAAKLLDFLADRHLSFEALQLRAVLVELPPGMALASDLLHADVTGWPPFVVKVDPLHPSSFQDVHSAEPTQTLVDLSTAEIAPRPVVQVARLAHELLGGVRTPSATGVGGPRHTPLANLSEAGNAVLRQGLQEPERFPSALDFLSELAGAQSAANASFPVRTTTAVAAEGVRAAAGVPAAVLAPGTRAGTPDVAPVATRAPAALPSPSETVPGVATAEGRSPTGRLLGALTLVLALLLAAAIGALVVANTRRPTPAPPPEIHGGTVTLDTKPEGAVVRSDGQELGRTPLNGVSLPAGKHILEIELPGYQTRPVEALVKEGALNNLGVIPLFHEVGQLSLVTDPPGSAFELVGPDGKTSNGTTPVTLDNLPTGRYDVRLRRSGFDDYRQTVEVVPGGTASVAHPFTGVRVSLTSDPTGATVYLGERELGRTPCTVALPAEGAELVSRLGGLPPVTERVSPAPDGSTTVEFKHPYGLVLVSSDRPDAQVNIAGVEMGRPPVQGILPPGRHQITVRVEGEPDQTRVAEVRPGGRFNLLFNFVPAPASGPSDAAAASANTPPPMVGVAPPGQTSLPAVMVTPAVRLSVAPTPRARPRVPTTPPPAPAFRTEEEMKQARKQAYRQFDAEWDGKKKALEREKDYYDYQADHSSGPDEARWKAKKETVKQRLDQLDDQKDAAEHELKRRWNDD